MRLYLLGILVILSASCRTQDTAGPVGWASFGFHVTGGGDATPVMVRDRAMLLEAVTKSDRVIQIPDTIHLRNGERIDITGSNLTIEGKGPFGMLHNGGINLKGNNIIVRNLSIGDAYIDGHWRGKGKPSTDAITVYGTHIWIDHCELFHGYDGLLDVSSTGPDYTGDLITVSWTKFYDHNKVMLIGSNDQCSECRGKHRVTVHHCWFDGASRFYDSIDREFYRVQQRMPRVRYGNVHVFNNYYEDVGDYAIAARFESAVYVERNYFRNLRDPHIIDDIGKGMRDPQMKVVENVYDNVGGEKAASGNAFCPGDHYAYLTDHPGSIPSLVMNGAGKYNRENNRPPKALPDHYHAVAGDRITLFLLENDTDPDGDSIRISFVDFPSSTTALTFPDHIVFETGTEGTFELSYQVIDFEGGTATSTATVTVRE